MRWRSCTFCGAPLTDFSFRAWLHAPHVVMVLLCPHCQRLGDDLMSEAVDIMLTRRYDPTRFGTEAHP